MIYDGSSGDGFTAATPNASDLVNINIVAGQITYQEDLGLITNAVSTGTGNNSVNTVAGAISNVNTVAGSISNVNAVAGNATNINAVAADATDIGAVAGKATEIGRLGTADAVADMNTLGTTAIVSDMDTLADISSNITTVAGISSNVTTVANNNANVTAVAGNNSNITAVAGNATNINAAVSNASNINTVSGIASNVTSVATNESNITTCAGSIGNVNTTAGSISNVNAVGGSIANVNTVASNITNVSNFANRYRIAGSDPGTNNDEGDLYFNTTSNELRVYNGSTWQGGVTATGNLAGLGANTFTGNQTVNANIIVTGTVDGVDIAALKTAKDSLSTTNGVLVDGVQATTKPQSNNGNAVATTSYVRTAVSNLVDSAPGTLDTLNELAAALGDDANYATTTANSIATKAPINNPTFTGTVTAGTITGSNLTLDFGTL